MRSILAFAAVTLAFSHPYCAVQDHVTHASPTISVVLSSNYGNASVSYGNGSSLGIAELSGTVEYVETMRWVEEAQGDGFMTHLRPPLAMCRGGDGGSVRSTLEREREQQILESSMVQWLVDWFTARFAPSSSESAKTGNRPALLQPHLTAIADMVSALMLASQARHHSTVDSVRIFFPTIPSLVEDLERLLSQHTTTFPNPYYISSPRSFHPQHLTPSFTSLIDDFIYPFDTACHTLSHDRYTTILALELNNRSFGIYLLHRSNMDTFTLAPNDTAHYHSNEFDLEYDLFPKIPDMYWTSLQQHLTAFLGTRSTQSLNLILLYGDRADEPDLVSVLTKTFEDVPALRPRHYEYVWHEHVLPNLGKLFGGSGNGDCNHVCSPMRFACAWRSLSEQERVLVERKAAEEWERILVEGEVIDGVTYHYCF